MDDSNENNDNENGQENEIELDRNIKVTVSKHENEDNIPSYERKLLREILWKYYTRLYPMTEKIARCDLCKKTISYKSTTANLKIHLRRLHPQVIAKEPLIKQFKKSETDTPLRRKNRGGVWRYFRKVKPVSECKAQCNMCFNLFSYKTTISNLKNHIARRHFDIVKDDPHFDATKYLQKGASGNGNQSNTSSDGFRFWEYLDVSTEEDEDDGNYGNSNDETVKLTSQIWSQFNHDDEEPTCNLCRELVRNTLEDMKNHLEEAHGDVLDAITSTALDAASEGENLEDDNIYTEVVYLEEEETPKTDNNKANHSRRESQNYLTNKQYNATPKPKRKISDSSDEASSKSNKVNSNPESNELDAFLNYLKVILQKVPTENSSKLHVDIINLVMNATETKSKIIYTENVKNGSILQNNNLNDSHKRTNTLSSFNIGNNDSMVIKMPLQSVSCIKSPKLVAISANTNFNRPMTYNSDELQQISDIVNKTQNTNDTQPTSNTN